MIMNEHLKSAQNSLVIRTVNLKESNILVRDEVDLPSLNREETITQAYRAVSRIQETSFTDSQKQEVWDYRFIYTSGVRLIFSEEEETSTDEGYKPIVEIVGVFIARYFSPRKLEEEELKAFCDDSVGYHVWPYWREYVQSSCARIDFSPVFEVPVYFMPQHKEES